MKLNTALRRGIVPMMLVVSARSFAPLPTKSNLQSSTTRLFSGSAISSLPPLLDSTGKTLSEEEASLQFNGKSVAYYFSAGWCPMCTSFEPSLLQFQQASKDSGKELELIYVSSDRSEDAALQRAGALKMSSVPYGEAADALKTKFGIWAGSEALKFGFGGRRSGVPALVVLDPANGDELAFLPTESQGVQALAAWPMDDETSLW